jgi:cell division protease FtsH
VAFEIDHEVRELIDEAHDVALDILTENREKLDALAAKLLEVETLERDDVEAFFADVERRKPRAHEERSAGLAVSRQAKRDDSDQGRSTPGTLRPKLGGPGLSPA